ncbi:unnamed protein product [Caenorhabditis sp. 36 PRJEB53466]|nr:unnamed protein product [Caenorhabditis sp. 36 PRJEB53466]
MLTAAPRSPESVEDGGNFSADSPPLNSDDEQLDDAPFLSHQLPDDHESFSEKFLRNILTPDYQNLMPRRREKFVEITKTVTVTEIVNGAPDKHPSSCEVKVTNVAPAGPHPVNVSIKHLHEKWHSCEELDGSDLGKGTIIHIHETHKPFNYTPKKQKQNRFVYEDVVSTKVDRSEKSRQPPLRNSPLFNRSSDNIIDLEFRHPILVETSEQKMNNGNGTRRRFADLRKKVSTTTKTSTTETEKVTTTRRSSSAHSTSSKRSYGPPEVHTLYYRKFVEEDTKKGDDSRSDSGSVIIHRDSATRRSQSADPLRHSPTMSPVAPPRKRLGREESLHYYRDDDEMIEQMEKERKVTVKSPEPGNTSVSMNDSSDHRNITAGITSISMNNSCTDTSFESRFSTIPRARSSPPGSHRVNHIHVKVVGPTVTRETEMRHPVVGRVGDDVTMDFFIDERRHRSASSSRRASVEAPPKPPRRSKWEDNHIIGEPIATSTPMTTIERKQTREERVSVESGQSSRKSTRSARPPDINIIECESFLRETRSPARTPATPIVVINQTPSSRRSSQDLLGDPAQRRRKSTVTDIDWYAAFNMKDPSSPTKPVRPPFGVHGDERKSSKDVRRRASDSSMIGIPPADIDLNQIFICTAPRIEKDEKCQCNSCRLIRMSEAERALRFVRKTSTRQSRSYTRTSNYEVRSSTLPSRHRTAPVEIHLEDVFNPKSPQSPTSPVQSKPPTPPNRRRPAAPQSSAVAPPSSVADESLPLHAVPAFIDRSQVTPVTTNSRDSQLNARNQLISSTTEHVDWVGQMMHEASEWEQKTSSRKSSTASSAARKMSVARRISVDELTKPEKKRSKGAVPLPPSDASIDDIFTALTQKREEPTSPSVADKRTFILTRKQRAQDVDVIDFEKDRQTPVAPPRSKKTEDTSVTSTASVILAPIRPTTSTATISLDDVFANGSGPLSTDKVDEEDEKIRRRVAEFTKSQQEKLVSRGERSEGVAAARKTSLEDADISLDDIFNSDKKRVEVVIPYKETSVTSTAVIRMRPTEESGPREVPAAEETPSEVKREENRTSAVSINLDDVFVEGSERSTNDDREEEEIQRRIAEFERTQQEKEDQRKGFVADSHSGRKIFETSDFSMEDVFNTSRTKPKSTEISTATVNLQGQPATTEETEEDRTIRKRIEEFERNEEEKVHHLEEVQEESHHHTAEKLFDDSDISMDAVFNAPDPSKEDVEDDEEKKISRRIAEFEKSRQEKEDQKKGVIEESHPSRLKLEESNISMDAVFNVSTTSEQVDTTMKDSAAPAKLSLDDVFVVGQDDSTEEDAEEKKIKQRITEFEKNQEERRVQAESREDEEKLTSPELDPSAAEVSTAVINLDDIFAEGKPPIAKPKEDEEDEKIRRRVAEFKKSKQEQSARTETVTEKHSTEKFFEKSDISMDDVFSPSSHSKPTEASASLTFDIPQTSAATIVSSPLKPTETSSASINFDDVFVSQAGVHPSRNDNENTQPEAISFGEEAKKRTSAASINLDDVFVGPVQREVVEDEEEKRIIKRVKDFEINQQEKALRNGQESEIHPKSKIFENSDISLDDVFNTSHQEKPSHVVPDEEDVIGYTSSEFEKKTKTQTTTRTETTSDTFTRKTVCPASDISIDDIFKPSEKQASKKSTLEDLFGPQTATPPAIPTVAITSDPEVASRSTSAPAHKHFSSGLMVPSKWNESMMSTTSTISLDDSFNNSMALLMNTPKMRKPLSLPVDNWIDDLVAKTTEEATREAPKTPKTPKSGTYFPSPTRISQEIKYEWVADLAGVEEEKEEEAHHTDEAHLQKHDNTWVSSVVYRPTLETSAYTLRASQPEQELDMDRVFDECLMGKKKKKKDDEECECSACRLTEQELEAMRKRQIESKSVEREESHLKQEESEKRRTVEFQDPSEFSIDTIFHPEVPLHIQTGHVQVPTTSSPPIQSSKTYYLSPKVSETVTTTHQWKDADISMDEIFSPVSSTTNENRRFSNFYEDRSGWDTIGSEDSGVMSGGGGRRRTSRIITDQVIDEAFKGIFDAQPTTPTVKTKPEQTQTHYDDFYITSLNEEHGEASGSELDGENLDVTQFVDHILGKSLDEAAFLSSTKSLRDHTDTSIDRKKSIDKVHPYYRTRTDTSMDKRSKPSVINEDHESHEAHEEILKLVFVDPPTTSKSESGTTKPSDEELLEIEIKSDYFLIKGSYSLLIPKTDPLGQMLQKLRERHDSLATLDFSLTRKLKRLLVSCIREKAGSLQMSPSSSKWSVDHASATFLRMNADKFEPTRNPRGIVNFCTAENNICTPLLEERFKHLELFFPNTESLVRYPPAGGWPEAREVLVKYFKEFMGARVSKEELVLTASTRTGYDVVSYCLFEQDDILLTNGPVYTGTISNVHERSQCHVECVETDLANPRLDVKKYEEELARQNALDNTVGGVIIVNPHNPLGVVFPPEDVVNLCNWAASKNLRVVIDEVFANCVFDKSASKFRPFLSYRHRVHRPESIAWLWSVSKDFGLPGLKFAVIHSANQGLRQAATKLQLYYPCSPFVQNFAVKLLSDSEWLHEFHSEVTRRMAIHYRYTADNLKLLEIPFVPAQAGIFVFADFSKYISSVDSAGELELFERLGSKGVMLTPGIHQKCHVFGWFRLVFACTKEELEEGFRRLYAILGSQLNPVGTVQYN